MADTMAELLGRIIQAATRVTDVAYAVTTGADRISEDSKAQRLAADTISMAIAGVTATADMVHGDSEEAQRESALAEQNTSEGVSTTAKAAEDIERVAATVGQAATVVGALGQRAQDISIIADTIQSIASQTNLLALNAAIEAARAGETGRGFAVVADEVKKLAEHTSHSTQQIRELIEGTQRDVQQAVGAMQDSVAQIDAGVASARKSGELIAALQDNVTRAVVCVQQIGGALDAQHTMTAEMGRQVDNVVQGAGAIESAASASLDTAQLLSQLAAQLEADVTRFKI